VKDATLNGATVDSEGSTIDEDERIVQILDQYLIDVEQGCRPRIESVIAQNQSLEGPLREAFEALSLLHSIDHDAASSLGASPRNLIPDRLDDFELGAELGRGAAGVVFAAHQVSLDRPVAVKVLAFSSKLDANRIERFYREATAAALLAHPHIVSVIGVGCCDGIHYYAMNRVHGASLDRRIEAARSGGPTALASPLVGEDRFRRIALFMADAADALAHAHASGIVHRDIKPSNLLLTDEGHVWVADFGLARIGGETDLTQSGELVGTLRYMSPEQASGRSEWIDFRTDIYALGATLYELILLRPVFEANDSASLLRTIQSSEPATPRAIDRSVPRPLEIIIRRAMRRCPSERYTTADELAEDLRRFALGQPIRASRVTLAERWIGYTRDHGRVVSASFLLVMVALAASISHNWIVSRQQAETRRALALSQVNYAQVRRVVDTLGADVAARLAAIPEAAEIRRDVLAETLGYYESFIADANDDPALVVDVAKTRLKIAQLVGSSGSSFAESDDAYNLSVQSLRAVDEQMGGDPIDQSVVHSLLVQALSEWAMLRSDHGKVDSVPALLDEALAVAEQIIEPRPRALAIALVKNNRGASLLRSGHHAEAMSEFEAAISLYKSTIADADTSHEILRGDLATSLANLGTLMSDAGHHSSAATLLEESLLISEHVAGPSGQTTADLRRRALSHNNLAAMRWRAGETDEAIASYGRAVELLEQVVSRLPGLPAVRRELAIALNNQGMALSSAKRFSESETAFRRAIAIVQPAADADPTNILAARECGGILNNLGVLLRECGRHEDAKQMFALAIEHQRRAGQLSPDDPENHRFLDQIRHNFVSVDG
jgi:eukaryotic-like serine/threonine-protein kinase